MLFMAKLFSSHHKSTKTLRKNKKKSFVSWWQIPLSSGLGDKNLFFQMKNLKKSLLYVKGKSKVFSYQMAFLSAAIMI